MDNLYSFMRNNGNGGSCKNTLHEDIIQSSSIHSGTFHPSMQLHLHMENGRMLERKLKLLFNYVELY